MEKMGWGWITVIGLVKSSHIFSDCYEVKNNYRLHSNDGEWEEIPRITQSACENRAKADPRYVGWTYADDWAVNYCYLMTHIRTKGFDSDFVSGLAKDDCENKRGKIGFKLYFEFLFTSFSSPVTAL
jgi:hypothetical protein